MHAEVKGTRLAVWVFPIGIRVDMGRDRPPRGIAGGSTGAGWGDWLGRQV